jgi:C-terminal processing protease CtpA/Prc
MINGTSVDNTVVGGPAYNSQRLSHGDIILKVDGVVATNENILDLLIGSDVPGSSVEITIAKNGSQAKATHDCFSCAV